MENINKGKKEKKIKKIYENQLNKEKKEIINNFKDAKEKEIKEIKKEKYHHKSKDKKKNGNKENNKEIIEYIEEDITDKIIQKLIDYNEIKENLTEKEIKYLILKSKTLIMSQPIFLELQSPITVAGDIHGQYSDLLRLFQIGGFPPETNYLFLGDYVDRGKQSIETICLLLAYKLKNPVNFFLVRGNHECGSINRIYGFYDECKRRYSVKLWKIFIDLFNCFPVAACIDDKILLVHGGISPYLNNINDISRIKRPTDVPEQGLLCDILWSDPFSSLKGWEKNERGISFTFNEKVLTSFLKKNELDLVCRAHQVVEDGYEFFGDKELVTVFSAPNYIGQFDNSGAIMLVDENLMCSFKIFKSDEIIDQKK